ncbi:hypothetical protein AVEN_29114-1 [Araneus ventricosus]|uniref:Uncharacterized protein n=1 Tax=Araneus ventricosus TaxID=182803 RepID=A0A4Y2AK74_ARAVE|nr:hypothetical protein AVEN_29114-1 [Araneus ventricosus]
MKTHEVISEDLDSLMQNMHEAIEQGIISASMLHSVLPKMDYCMDVARLTKGNHGDSKTFGSNFRKWRLKRVSRIAMHAQKSSIEVVAGAVINHHSRRSAITLSADFEQYALVHEDRVGWQALNAPDKQDIL